MQALEVSTERVSERESISAPHLPKKERSLLRLFGTQLSGEFGVSPVHLEAFIEPSGLPVRIVVTVRFGGETVRLVADTYAINFPLAVEPPPPALTIREAALERIERKRHRKRSGDGLGGLLGSAK